VAAAVLVSVAALALGAANGARAFAAAPAARALKPTSGTARAATTTASPIINITLFMFIFYPSPKLFGKTDSFLPLLLSGNCRMQSFNFPYSWIHNLKQQRSNRPCAL